MDDYSKNIEELNRDNQVNKYHRLQNSRSYMLVNKIKVYMDDYFLDPIIGFVFPAFGDILASIMAIPYLYISAVKVRSVPLTLAVFQNIMIDVCMGCIPCFGSIVDIFFKSYKRNYQLIVGFVNNDKEVVAEVNRRAVISAIIILILCFLTYLLIRLSVELIAWLLSLFF